MEFIRKGDIVEHVHAWLIGNGRGVVVALDGEGPHGCSKVCWDDGETIWHLTKALKRIKTDIHIEKICVDGINDIVAKIQAMLDPECKHDLGGEANFFTFQDGKGFNEFIEEITTAMSFYHHATKIKQQQNKD